MDSLISYKLAASASSSPGEKPTLSRAPRWVHSLLQATLISLLLASCAVFERPGHLVDPSTLPPYRIEIHSVAEPDVSSDGYKVLLRFTLHSRGLFPYHYLIQEIEQSTSYLTKNGRHTSHDVKLVETFRLVGEADYRDGEWIYQLEPHQRDKHFESGFVATPQSIDEICIHRKIRLYPGVVEGADFTMLGFAHLPSNRDGSVTTNIPSNFNRSYQDDHHIRGRIVVDDRDANAHLYHLKYLWQRTTEGGMQATLTFDPKSGDADDVLVVSSSRPAAPTAGGAGSSD